MKKDLGFPWNLHVGDEVYWDDPDKTCAHHMKIHVIEYHGERGDPECIIRITEADGSFTECFARELK
jgi:hypothetical protein